MRPCVKALKNDDRDAGAIAEAATWPTMWFVALKTEAQLDVQVLDGVRDRLGGQGAPLMNQMRSILLERRTVLAQGRRGLLKAPTGVVGAGGGQRSGKTWSAGLAQQPSRIVVVPVMMVDQRLQAQGQPCADAS